MSVTGLQDLRMHEAAGDDLGWHMKMEAVVTCSAAPGEKYSAWLTAAFK